MLPKLTKITTLKENNSVAILLDNPEQLPENLLNESEFIYLKNKLEKDDNCTVYKYPCILFFEKIIDRESYLKTEAARIAGSKLFDVLKVENIKSVQIVNLSHTKLTLSFLEGLLLSQYTFAKYKKEKNCFSLDEIFILDETVSENQFNEMLNLIQAVFYARDLVNEPLSYLSAVKLSEEISKMGKEAGFAVEIFNKSKIETLKMGGLLAVNKGSIDPPTFTVIEWKPENAINSDPVVLVGKGVVFDTGGLSLKPTQKSMDYMKSDMAGGAVAAATVYAAAKNKLLVHVIGLIPATDNRPDGNAYVPGDVITMFDGTTVEIKSTDAEGRLILADALSFAKKFNPELVIDIATLTGAAAIVAGQHAIVGMGNSKENIKKLKKIGFETCERIIEVPLWDEYAKSLKSKIADLNNLGIREAQSITAGKFLEHFTDYKWIHLDAASVSFLFEKDAYRSEGGTGFGIRLLYNFLKESIKR
ncbi:MAG: peptidase M17 [Bacteroidales bacterium]|jgi:leucyl aminopeptidase|nr:peptidase M17 [Bacteroidales bacterium]